MKGEQILIVEGDRFLRETMELVLEQDYSVSTAETGKEALNKVYNHNFDLVIMELNLKDMKGLELLDKLTAIRPPPYLVPIIIADQSDLQTVIGAFKKGAYDYISKPFDGRTMIAVVQRVLEKRRLTLENIRLTEHLRIIKKDLEQRVKERTFELEESKRALEASYMEVVNALAIALEEKDQYTRGHSKRVTEISLGIALELNFTEEQLKVIKNAAQLHDIGKIGIDGSILRKPCSLTEEEKAYIAEHAEKGYKILEPISYLSRERDIIRQHHERVDGCGYPRGLDGSLLMVEAKVLAVADAFDAMSSDRPYRKALDLKTCFDELRRCSGTQFDKKIVEAFFRYWQRQNKSISIN